MGLGSDGVKLPLESLKLSIDFFYFFLLGTTKFGHKPCQKKAYQEYSNEHIIILCFVLPH